MELSPDPPPCVCGCGYARLVILLHSRILAAILRGPQTPPTARDLYPTSVGPCYNYNNENAQFSKKYPT